MDQIIPLIICGVGAGLLSSFFGVGGGIIIVPFLYFAFPNWTPSMIAGTSLGVIFFNSVLNSYLYYKKGHRLGKNIIILYFFSMGIGVYTGLALAHTIDPKIVRFVLASMLLFVAYKTFRKRPKVGGNLKEIPKERYLLLFISCVLSGILSGLTGLGGGAILVPILISVIGLVVTLVPVYSNMAMTFGALIGVTKSLFLNARTNLQFMPDFAVGQIHFAVIFIIFCGAYFGAKLGIKLNERIPQRKAEIIFAIFLIITGLKIFSSL
ncbi:MAG: sulfite exporter TauE/SafE family protein [Bacteriovoracaceae bacterium]